MKKQMNRRERFKMSSIAFMNALKPKINRSGKKKKESGQTRASQILLRSLDEKLTRYPGAI